MVSKTVIRPIGFSFWSGILWEPLLGYFTCKQARVCFTHTSSTATITSGLAIEESKGALSGSFYRG